MQKAVGSVVMRGHGAADARETRFRKSLEKFNLSGESTEKKVSMRKSSQQKPSPVFTGHFHPPCSSGTSLGSLRRYGRWPLCSSGDLAFPGVRRPSFRALSRSSVCVPFLCFFSLPVPSLPPSLAPHPHCSCHFLYFFISFFFLFLPRCWAVVHLESARVF